MTKVLCAWCDNEWVQPLDKHNFRCVKCHNYTKVERKLGSGSLAQWR